MNSLTIVITGHGNYATGIASSLALLGSFPENYYAIDFTEEMSDTELGSVYKEIVAKEEKVVFFTDLLGGTPFKEAATLAMSNDQLEVVTGCNMGSLLETAFNHYETPKELASTLVATSIKYTEHFVNEVVEESSSLDVFDDGI